MSLTTALAAFVGKAIATKLIQRLLNKPKGTTKIAAVAALVEQGKPIIDAFKGVFGDDFLKELNAAIGTGKSSFAYEAGTADYIKADTDSPHPPLQILRDELNINLDRLNFIETNDKEGLKNYFRGMFHVWKRRHRELAPDHHNDDAKGTFDAIDKLLNDEPKTFADLFELTKVTALGVGGTLMVISAVCIATTTGVGMVAAISAFLFGIPWLSVAGLAIPGVLLLGLAAMQLRDDQAMSACVQLAYKLIERQMGATSAQAIQPTSHQPTTEREQ